MQPTPRLPRKWNLCRVCSLNRGSVIPDLGIPELVNIDMDAKPVAIGTLSCDEQETLYKLLSTGITQCSAAPSTSAATDVKLQIPTSAEVNDTDTDTFLQSAQQLSNIDTGTPEHVVPCFQKAHVKLPPNIQGPNIDSSTDKTDKAQPNLVLP